MTLFTFGERLGLVFIAQAACLSALAVTFFLGYKLVGALKNWFLPRPQARYDDFPLSHVEIYFINLMISDLVQAIGAMMNIGWVIHARVIENELCIAQAAFKQIGDVGVALSVMAISIHTFCVLFFKWTPPSSPLLAIVVIGLIWLFLILDTSVGYTTHTHYYGQNGYWCWIDDSYRAQEIVSEYLWMWLTAILNIFLYFLLFFCLRGNIITTGRRVRWRWIKSEETWVVPDTSLRHTAIARQMLWYPVAYMAVILPISAVRFLSFYNHKVAFPCTVFGGVLLGLSGVINVTLYSLTRPLLHPSRKQRDSDPRLSILTSHGRHDSLFKEDYGYQNAPPQISINRTGDWINTPDGYEIEEFPMSQSWQDASVVHPFIIPS
ncbi:hypothetical protein BOTBODRAFT_174282 [Botryobasidium botryosum FD-172 SS1]|uniref:Glucose receptor Git3 N-terminal domain-containing protein n=1 Tax=Botryobasidium botryosum (strain FD-172 SS1) TaxID=930990 RepID=A0A067MHU0_BOTB1|nr:hypothetical protein BOTBODRAFT_174282 [Botryobasidium botryosum FD-172 SS1]